MSLIPQQLPEQRMHTVTIDEIISLVGQLEGERPALENYFSPTRREMFEKDYIHYLNSSLLAIKHGKLDLDKYLGFVLSFQFTAPLLEISCEREMVLFYRILEERYEVGELDINLHFMMGEDEADLQDTSDSGGTSISEEGSDPHSDSGSKKNMIGEAEALRSFRQELENSYEGRREAKETMQKRLKQDGIEAIMKWQQLKGIPELAEAFGRSVVIPSFFSFTDKKLLGFYRQNTNGITYEVAVPDFE